MSRSYRTRDGDMLDAICRKHYGTEAAVVAVLEANPGLSERPPRLPAGILITLPAVETTTSRAKTVRLWGGA